MISINALEMPKWGMTMEEGTLTEWLVAEGEQVSEGTPVATVESSKISGELEAPVAGVLRRQVATKDDTVPVGTLLGVVADAEASDAEIDDFIAQRAPAQQTPEPAAAAAPVAPAAAAEAAAEPAAAAPAKSAAPAPPAPAPVEAAPRPGETRIPDSLKGEADGVPATAHAAKLAQEHGIALTRVTATGRGGRITVTDLLGAVNGAGGQLSFGNDRPRVGTVHDARDDSEVPATPHARRIARERRINLHQCRATGRAGRVTVSDVMALLARQAPPAAPAAPASNAPAPAPADATITNTSSTTAMSGMRKVIAERLKASYSESPHYRVTAHADVDKLLALRQEINDSRLDVRVSVNDLLVAAVAKTLVEIPEVNAHYDPARREVTQFDHADVAIAVSTGNGLITPILTHADTRSITEISTLSHDLATRAKAGTLGPDEFQGGTFTISNLGMFGVSQFDAIINPPQVAILAVGSTQRTFVPDAAGQPVAASLLPLTLSSDHRVVDGALAAKFLKRLRQVLETPSLIYA